MTTTNEVPQWVSETEGELETTESDKYDLPADASDGGVVVSQLECDYDKNPTVLYQALEARQWDYAAGLFKGGDITKEVATWVVRKETTGKLRWRLLPLHAAIIFGGPLRLIELLLSEYPIAAQCKDDQGMLPLHLAFRHETTWDIVEELLTSYPQAVFVKDRKGRIPLLSAIKAPLPSSGTSVNSSMSHMPSEHSKAFKSAVSVLEIYTQVSVSLERQRAVAESRSVLDQRIGQLQDSHLQTLTLLKKEWQKQQEESKHKIKNLTDENKGLQNKVERQEAELQVSRSIQKDLTSKLLLVTDALERANIKNDQSGASRAEHFQHSNDALRSLVDDLVQDQRSYHGQFQDLMARYEKLMEDRQRVMSVFEKQTTLQAEKEAMVIRNFKSWMGEQEQKQRNQSQHPQVHNEQVHNEEKKVEEEGGSRTLPQLTIQTTPSGLIDLSQVASP